MSLKTKPKLKLNVSATQHSSQTQATSITNDRVSKESRMKLKDDDLEFISDLGSGSGGSVSKCLHKPTNQIMARKASSICLYSCINQV